MTKQEVVEALRYLADTVESGRYGKSSIDAKAIIEDIEVDLLSELRDMEGE